LEQNVSNLTAENERHRDIEKQITNILGSITIDSSDNPNKKEETTPHRICLKRIIPMINMFLLIVLLFATTFKSCSSKIKSSADEDAPPASYLQLEKEEELNKVIKEKNKQIQILKNKLAQTANMSNNGKDIDCKLTIYQDNKPVDASKINIDKEITVFVNPQEGYTFYTSNLKAINITNGVPFKLEKIHSNRPIIITYRSLDRNKCNQLNVVTIQ